MTELDLEIPGLAEEIINEFGKVVSFGAVALPGYNVSTGEVVSAVPGALPTLKAIVEPDKGQALRMGLVEGVDFKLTIAAQSLPNGVSTEDRFTFDGTTYKVINVKPTYSGELIALYEIWVAV